MTGDDRSWLLHKRTGDGWCLVGSRRVPAPASAAASRAELCAWLDDTRFPDGRYRAELAADTRPGAVVAELDYVRDVPLPPVRSLRERGPVVHTCRLCAPILAAHAIPTDRSWWCAACGRRHSAVLWAHLHMR
ncbi:MAG TPA: hypothetical protein VFW65_31830 [Pseudonocardiaceae bacterium]|nr:hypothetical protein [Pseudonocardiaceae bacterium]